MRMDKRLSQLSKPILMSPEDWRKLKMLYDQNADTVPARVLSNWGVRQQAAEDVIERSLNFVRPLFGTNGALRFLPKSAQSFVLKRLGGDHLRGQQLVNFLLNEITI